MSKTKQPVDRPKTRDLVTFSIKIPRKLQAQLDKARSSTRVPPGEIEIQRIDRSIFNYL